MGVEMVRGSEFLKDVVGGGLVRVWETRRACGTAAVGGQAEWAAAEKEIYARELAEVGEEQANVRSAQRQGLRRLSDVFGLGQAPLWRVVTGLMPGMDWERLHPNERAGRLTQLIRAVEKVVRYEWRAFEKMGDEGRTLKAEGSENSNDEGEEGRNENDDPRVSWWDPMRVVCEHFGIAYSMLSRLSRETCGLSASDLTDRVKAERVRTRMREDVRAWVREIYLEEENNKESELHTLKVDDAVEFLWSRVAVKRGRGRWSRAAWAVKFGYSSYTRFQRACLAQYGISPVELERVVLEEVLTESQRSEVTNQRSEGAEMGGGVVLDERRDEVREAG